MSDEYSRASNAVALGSCLMAASVPNVLYTASRGDLGSLGYPVLVTGLSLFSAALLVLIAGRRSPGSLLALWVVFEAYARFRDDPWIGLGLGALCAAAVLWTERRAGTNGSPASLGIIVGCALFLGFVVAPTVVVAGMAPSVDPKLMDFASMGTIFVAVSISLGAILRSPSRVVGFWGWAPLLGLSLSVAVAVAANVYAAVQAPPRHFDSPPTAKGPNVLLLILDTVRPDHLSLYGSERDTTPRLKERLGFEQGAMVYPRAYSTSNWTRPAHVSLFTGLLSSEHGCREGPCGFVGASGGTSGIQKIALPETLASRLAAAGYNTGGVMGNPHLLTLEGLGDGFDVWKKPPNPMSLHGVGALLRQKWIPRIYGEQIVPFATAKAVNRDVLDLLDGCAAGGCYVAANYIDLHQPYWPTFPYFGRFGGRGAPPFIQISDSPERLGRAAAAYDEQILELDAHLGALLDELERRGLLDQLWLFVVGDHGESFGEHRSVRHGTNVYDDQVRIPLVVRPPRGVKLPTPMTPVGLLDVTATISAVATGTPMGRGRDLRRGDQTSLVQVEFFGWSETSQSPYAGFPSRVVVRGHKKLLEIGGRYELYDLTRDPGELNDRALVEPEEVERLAPLLPPLDPSANTVQATGEDADQETIDALRALGYIE